MIWTDAGESDKCPQRVAVPWMCHLPYLNSFPWSPPMSWLLHLAAGLLCLASLHITQATVVSNRHAHLDCNGYFYTHTHIRTHSHTRTLQKDSHRPPNIPHQQASTLNVAPHSLLECWEVYMDIIATLCATLTTSEAHPVDLLSNAPQQIKGGGGSCERGTGRIGYFSGCYDDDKSGAI